jgi:hypothetical protein
MADITQQAPAATPAPAPQLPSWLPYLEGLAGALGNIRGGVLGALGGGLGSYSRGLVAQQQLPLQTQQTQANIARTQAQTPLLQEQAAGLKKTLAPISPDMIAQLDHLAATATDPQEKDTVGFLAAAARTGNVSYDQIVAGLKQVSEDKLAKTQQALTNRMMLSSFGLIPPSTPAAAPSAAPSGAPASAASTSPAAATPGDTPPFPTVPAPSGMRYTMNIGGKKVPVYQNAKDKKWYYEGPTGWQPLNP